MGSQDDQKQPSTGFGTLARTYRDVAPYLGLGIQLAATVVIFALIGHWLDRVLDTSPWLLVIAALLGATAGLYNFIRTVISLSRKQKQQIGEGKRR